MARKRRKITAAACSVAGATFDKAARISSAWAIIWGATPAKKSHLTGGASRAHFAITAPRLRPAGAICNGANRALVSPGRSERGMRHGRGIGALALPRNSACRGNVAGPRPHVVGDTPRARPRGVRGGLSCVVQ